MTKRILSALPLIMTALSLTTAIYADEHPETDKIAENKLIEKFHQIRRNGILLEIEASSGSVKFRDNPSEGESYSRNFVIKSYPVSADRTDFLVTTHAYEGAPRYTLINGSNGATSDLTSKPILSPTHAYYFSFSTNLEAESEDAPPNAFKILEASEFRVEFEKNYLENDEKDASGPYRAKWIGADKIQLDEKKITATDQGAANSVLFPTVVEKIDGKWIQHPLKMIAK